jgi:hypothetical protein
MKELFNIDLTSFRASGRPSKRQGKKAGPSSKRRGIGSRHWWVRLTSSSCVCLHTIL